MKLPGQDSNLDKENQNGLSAEHKPLPDKTCDKSAGAVVRALGKPAPGSCPLDPDLILVMDRWPILPAAIRRAIRALVEHAGTGE